MSKDKIADVNTLCLIYRTYVNDKGNKIVAAYAKIKNIRKVFGLDIGVDFKMLEHTSSGFKNGHVITKCIVSTKDPEFVVATATAKVFRDAYGYIESSQTFSYSRALSYMGVLDQDVTSAEEHFEMQNNIRMDVKNANGIDVEMVKQFFKEAKDLNRIKYLREVHADYIDHLCKNSLRDFRQLTDVIETREIQLESQQAQI